MSQNCSGSNGYNGQCANEWTSGASAADLVDEIASLGKRHVLVVFDYRRYQHPAVVFSLLGVTTVAECGPGKVLAGLTKRCADGVTGVALADAAAIQANLGLE